MRRLGELGRFLVGFGILCLALAGGNLVSAWVPLPGPLIGMVALFAFLTLCQNPLTRAVIVCGEVFLRYYAFFFVPAGVGLMVHFSALRG